MPLFVFNRMSCKRPLCSVNRAVIMQMKYENSRSWGTTIQSDYFHDNDQTIKPNGIGEHLSAQFNLVQYVNWFCRRGDITDDPTEILYQSFLHGALVSSLAWADMSTLWRCSFSISTKASPTLQGAPKDCLGEAVVVCDMPEPCKFMFLDNFSDKVSVAPTGSWSCSSPTHWS